MRDLYKMFDVMIKKKIYFNFQSQSSEFYNIAVEDIHGKTHYLDSENLDDIEKKLKVIWGHLIMSVTPVMKLPIPPGFPRP